MRHLISFVFFLILIASAQTTLAGTSCPLNLGTNMSGPVDFGAEYPWVNIMTCSRGWLTHNAYWVSEGENLWDTQAMDQIPVDAQGYPLSLPHSVAGAEVDQIVRTVWANTGLLPAGTWVVLWDGQGTLDAWGDGVNLLTNDPGRLTFDLIPVADGILALEIEQSQSGNHVRNLKVLMPGTEATYSTNEWDPRWISGLDVFTTLRFMDWGKTNNSTVVSWSERTQPNNYTFTPKGVPYERWVEICNRLDKDAWVCVPHLADDNYIRQMARLFRDGLNPERKIYLEYSNEIWNWMFDQTHYCNNQGNQSVPWPERLGPFIQNVMDIWTEEFAGQEDRLVRTIGVQESWLDVSNRIVGSLEPGSFDAFAPAAYIHLPTEGYTALESLGAAATADTVLHYSWIGLNDHLIPSIRNLQHSLGDAYSVPMLYYEGGQHLTPSPFGSIQPYAPALVAAQGDPEMHNLYEALLDSLELLVPEGQQSLFANFSYIANPSLRYGSWGVLEHQFLESPTPKFQALIDFACLDSSSVDEDPELPPTSIKRMGIQLASPNPFNPGTAIHYELATDQNIDLAIYDVSGKLIRNLLMGAPQSSGPHSVFWDGRRSDGNIAAAGIYLCRLVAGKEISTLSVCLLK